MPEQSIVRGGEHTDPKQLELGPYAESAQYNETPPGSDQRRPAFFR